MGYRHQFGNDQSHILGRRLIAIATIAALGVAVPVEAQAVRPEATPAPDTTAASPPEGPSGQVEEILVTAQRRSENLQQVPISVTAVTAATLARANITSTSALQQITPGLTWTTTIRTSLPYIRGVGSTDSSVGAENPVALYIDGVYIDSSVAASLQLNNIERVEVLKGPQGTLFGRNATGGLIQVITRTPSQTFGGEVEAGYGNYDTVRGSLYLTGPVTGKLAADIAVLYTDESGGWGRNITTGQKTDIDRNIVVRSKWLLDLDDTSFTLVGDYARQRTDIGNSRNIVPGAINPFNTRFSGGFYDSQSEARYIGTLRQAGVSLQADHSFDFGKLSSITAYRDTFFSAYIDQDETPKLLFTAYFDEIRIRTFTQELHLASEGGGRLDWIVGGFFMKRHGFQPRIRLTGSRFAPNAFLALDDGVRTTTGAPFAQATYHLDDKTSLTLGARYSIEHQEFEGTQKTPSGVVIASANGKGVNSVTYKKATFRAAIDHRFTPDVMTYASFNRGFKGGVYNVNALTAPPARPETLDAYEIGFKSDLLDRRLRINGAAFRYDYTNIQLLVANASNTAIANTINAGKARVYGFEGSVDAVPVDRLTASLGASYIPYAKYLVFKNAPLFVPLPGGGNAQRLFDASGTRLVRTPKFNATASINYSVPTAGGELDFGGTLYHSSSYAWNSDQRYRQNPYETVSAQASYKFANTGLQLSVWAQNLLDKKYMAGLSESTSGDVYIPAAPRTYGFKANYKF